MELGALSNTEIWIYASITVLCRYLVLAGGFYLIFYLLLKHKFKKFKIQTKELKKNQISREIGYSLLTLILYGLGIRLFIYWINEGMTLRYAQIETYGLPYFVFSILLMILMHDAYFYWTHRLMHHRLIYRYTHLTHHKFTAPTPWAAFAFHPLETMISMGIIPLIVFVVPFHQWALICFISFMIFNNILIHLGFNIRAFCFTNFQNTAMDHDYHHHKGRDNYGLYFTFWDRLMGTYYDTRPAKNRTEADSVRPGVNHLEIKS